jgi:hypothetical protein
LVEDEARVNACHSFNPEWPVLVQEHVLVRGRLQRRLATMVFTLLGTVASPVAALSPRAPVCADATRRVPNTADNATALLARAIDVVGIATVNDRLRVSTVTDVTSLDYQSDRPYPPYLWSSREQRIVTSAARRAVRLDLSLTAGGPAIINDGERQAVISPRGAQQVPLQTTNLVDERALDPWLVLLDWRNDTSVRVSARCQWRERERVILSRGAGPSAAHLVLDPMHGYPLALERREPHVLWGDVYVQYSWSIWTPVAGSRAVAPMYAFRLVDGEVNLQRRHGPARLWPADSATLMTLPATLAPINDAPLEPDTVRVADRTFLLRTASYTNVVTLQRDTVFVLDAPVDAERARRDSAWIGRLFPGRHPIVVIVTDLAWPHIAGVRYWAARRATIVTRAEHRPFIERVLERRWTLAPDALESRRRTTRFAIRSVHDGLLLAGGAVRVLPIDGVGSEGAQMVFLPDAGFLWAGDFVQPGGPESFSRVYAEEVAAAVTRAGIVPTHVAAMHFPLTVWSARPTR